VTPHTPQRRWKAWPAGDNRRAVFSAAAGGRGSPFLPRKERRPRGSASGTAERSTGMPGTEQDRKARKSQRPIVLCSVLAGNPRAGSMIQLRGVERHLACTARSTLASSSFAPPPANKNVRGRRAPYVRPVRADQRRPMQSATPGTFASAISMAMLERRDLPDRSLNDLGRPFFQRRPRRPGH